MDRGARRPGIHATVMTKGDYILFFATPVLIIGHNARFRKRFSRRIVPLRETELSQQRVPYSRVHPFRFPPTLFSPTIAQNPADRRSVRIRGGI